MSATLFVLATPIGNLEDITRRALRILEEVDAIACEDTRISRRLLDALGIVDKPLYSLHKHNEFAVCELILDKVAAGSDIALISDAGTPLISDPGAMITSLAHQRGLRVCPIPGACALTAALSASGISADRFFFAGFIPSKTGEKMSFLQQYRDAPYSSIFYETPHRIADTLHLMAEIFSPERKICIAREISKIYEEIALIPLASASAWLAENKNRERGEFVLVLEKAQIEPKEDWQDFALELRESGLSARDVSQLLSKHCGANKKEVYRFLCAKEP